MKYYLIQSYHYVNEDSRYLPPLKVDTTDVADSIFEWYYDNPNSVIKTVIEITEDDYNNFIYMWENEE